MRLMVTFTFCLLACAMQALGMHQYKEEVNGLVFGPVEQAIKTDLLVLHMEIDKMYPENILFSSGQHIFSMNMDTGESTKIIGSNYHADDGLRFSVGDLAETFFGRISSFLQLANNDILMVDEENSVLVLVKRGIRKITSEIFSGTPGTSMDKVRNGIYRDARFYAPRDIARFGTNDMLFFVSEPKLRAICKLRNTGEGDVERHMLKESQLIIGLTYSLESDTMFASSDAQLFTVNPRDVTLKPLTKSVIRNGGEPYYRDGPLNRATFGFASGLTVLGGGTLLVLDSTNHRIRVANVHEGVTSICGGDAASEEVNGPYDECVIHHPLSSIRFNSTIILVGTHNAVWRMSVKPSQPKDAEIETDESDSLSDEDESISEPPGEHDKRWSTKKISAFLKRDYSSPDRPLTSATHGGADFLDPVAMRQRSAQQQSEYDRKLDAAQKSARAAIFITLGMLCVLVIIVVIVATRVYKRMHKQDQLVDMLESQNEARLAATGSLAWELNRLDMLRQAEDAAIADTEQKIHYADRKLTILEDKIRRMSQVSPRLSMCRKSQAMNDMVVEDI